MQHWQKRLLAAVVVLLLAFGLTPLFTKNQTTVAAEVLDYVNPVLPTQTVYLSPKTSSVQWRANNHGGRDYRYHVKSFDENGRPRELVLTVSDAPLETTSYLAVSTKGQTVRSWHKVKASAIPKAALAQLKKQ